MNLLVRIASLLIIYGSISISFGIIVLVICWNIGDLFVAGLSGENEGTIFSVGLLKIISDIYIDYKKERKLDVENV